LVTALNLVLLLSAAAALVAIMRLRGRWAVLAFLLPVSLLPVTGSLTEGQSDLLIVAILTAVAALWTHDRPGWAGMVAGLALFKPQLIVLIPALFFVRHAWRAL